MNVHSIALLLGLTLAGSAAGDGVRGYYRYPALSGETLVFTAEGDLWSVGVSGGVARRLTSHLGEESRAAISPDGTTLAFSAQYDGPTEVYTMPLAGGLPVRRTWDGETAAVAGFDPQGRVLYATQHYSTLPDTQLVALDLKTGQHEQLPLRQIREASWDPQGTLFFTRLPHQGSHTKRYRGGTAQQIWTLAQGAPEASLLTGDYAGTSRTPMFWDGRLYFASDRDGTLNLWSLRPDGSDPQQHTRHRGLDVLSPSLSGGRIAYQLGADLRVFDARSGADREVEVVLASDLDQQRERWIAEPFDYLTSAHISPSGDRVALTARGQVFVAPARQGRLVEASRHPGARYRQARFASDGKSLVVLSDQTGEVEVWRLPADGVGAPSALTSDGKVLRFEVVPSPDGKRVAYHDKNRELWVQDLGTRKPVRVAASSEDEFRDLSWSPDGQWLAYVQTAPSAFLQIRLWSAASGTSTAVTSERVDSWSPAWSPDGKWLYLLSDRNFQSLTRSPWGNRQPEPYFDKATRIYQLALKPGLRSPFQPNDELFEEPGKDEKTADQTDEKKKGGAKPKTLPKVDVVLAGLAERVQELPVPAGNYAMLGASEKRLFWFAGETAVDPKQTLMALQIGNEPPEPQALVEDVRGYELSADGKKLLVRREKELHVLDADASAPAKLDKTRVDLSAWRFPLDPREEWRQMFDEAWRLHRDYFYDTAMHGVDWPAMRTKYRPLVERVTDRAELSDLLAQMVGELSALHTFVYGGDQRKGKDAIEPASLGAVLVRDEAKGGVRVERIYKSDPDYPADLGPLLQPGVDVRPGDVLEAINGVELLSVPDPGLLLRNQAGRQVRLRVKPAAGGALREAIVTPISADRLRDLRYDDWEYTRRLEVERLGKGELGYVHLRAMGGDNYNEWAREFYPVFGRKGLIVDVRHNRGGNIDSWILGRLLRRAWMYWQPRVGSPYWNMQGAFRGHLVVLMDEYTASDGEAFAEGFRRLGLGKLIGTRTWGGEIWLTSSNVLVDKGIATAAEFGVYGPEGHWLIEGHGVDPDMVVDNPPRASYEGQDAQLETAVKHLQERILAEPVEVPKPPEHPNLSHPHQQPSPGEVPGH